MGTDKSITINPPWDGDQIKTLIQGDPLWDFENLKVLDLWSKFKTQGELVNCYVIDSGISSHHLFAHKPYEALSFMDDDESPVDGNGHGTWCCGKISAKGVGIAPESKLASLRTLDNNGSGYTYYSTDALRWVLSQPNPHIVNMSLGSFYRSATQQSVINQLWDKGCIVVAAAGNENTSDLSYPAAYEHVLAVAAIDENSDRAWFSNYGDHICVGAPGVSCYSTYLNSNFRKLMGTSMASPTVAGLLALGYSYQLKKHPGRSLTTIRDLIIDCLKTTAVDLGSDGKDDYYGYGGIDGMAFMEKVSLV